MSRRRQLSDDERVLWEGVARSVAPLRGRRVAPAEPEPKTEPKPASVVLAPGVDKPAADKRIVIPRTGPPLLAPLGRRQRQRVARGRDAIDARLDLHGLTLGEAHHALQRFLRRAQADGVKIALVVTGKGTGKGTRPERGALRREVPLWLGLPEFRPYVVGFESAHIGHGGEGALYVRVRRPR